MDTCQVDTCVVFTKSEIANFHTNIHENKSGFSKKMSWTENKEKMRGFTTYDEIQFNLFSFSDSFGFDVLSD